MASFVAYGRCAAKEAIEDAGIDERERDAPRDDVGVSFGAGMGGASDLTRAGRLDGEG